MKRSMTSEFATEMESPVSKFLQSSYRRRTPSRTICGDRFIPSRASSNFDLFNLPYFPNSTCAGTDSPYITLLKSTLFEPSTPDNSISGGRSGNMSGDGGILQMTPPNGNIFKYKTETRKSLSSLSPFGSDDDLPPTYRSPAKVQPCIPNSPYKILDAPALQDDFYLNLVDWSSQDVLAVGLGGSVYLWHAANSMVVKLCDLGMDDSVSSVGWTQHGRHLAIGTNNGKVQLWDASQGKKIRTMEGHHSRVSALAWNPTLLSSGSQDKSILQRDIRSQEDYVSKLNAHKSEVCGLKWSCDNRQLASGGNDNRLYVWNQQSTQPVLKYSKHKAAVKAISWSPHVHGLLASGGGTTDGCLQFYNTTTNSTLNNIQTGSQVCNLMWSKSVNQLVSTHGYSQNQIIVWKYPTMSKLATLTGHQTRVLYLSSSPDGQSIVTGAGDETLRFWKVFPSPKSKRTGQVELGSAFSRGRSMIR